MTERNVIGFAFSRTKPGSTAIFKNRALPARAAVQSGILYSIQGRYLGNTRANRLDRQSRLPSGVYWVKYGNEKHEGVRNVFYFKNDQ